MNQVFLRCVVCALTGLLPAATASAQSRPEDRSLFGGGVGDADQLLVFSGSMGAGVATNVLVAKIADESTESSTEQVVPGPTSQFESAGAELTYSVDRPRLSFRSSAATSGRYYPGFSSGVVASHGASAGASYKLSPRTTVSASQGLTYEPLYTPRIFAGPFGGALGEAVTANQNQGATRDSYLAYVSTFQWRSELSRRAAASVTYDARRNVFQSADRTQWWQSVGGGFSFAVAKGVAARLGYRYSHSGYPNAGRSPSFQGHDIDVGVDVNRELALSLSRRTTVSFQTGAAVVRDVDRAHYRLTGNAQLTHRLHRDWHALVNYGRNVGFVESFLQPVFSDSLTGSVNGIVGRRLQIQSSIGTAIGDVGLGTSANRFTTSYGLATLATAVTRNLAVSVTYSYYRYAFSLAEALPAGVPKRLDRQGVQASLDLWAPLMHRVRRPNASR